MLKGWFDAFRSNGGPTLYTCSNRTPVVEDIQNVLVYVSFSAIFLAFLIVFPGVRKERLSTFVYVTLSLFIGAVILVSNFGSDWHVAQSSIYTSHYAFSRQKVETGVGVHIGFTGVNITLRAVPKNILLEDINYNERFNWIEATDLKGEYRKALIKGLPYPILTIAEYLSQDLEGFCWGRRYRLAGYYSGFILWVAFSLWLLMNILLCTLPRYGAYCMQLTGGAMLSTNVVFLHLIPRKPLSIPFEGGHLSFRYGWCFWLVLVAGQDSHSVIKTDLVIQPTTFSPDAAIPGPSQDRIDNTIYENDDGDVSTIFNGKRAVSLHSFGKFTQKEAAKKELMPPFNRFSDIPRSIACHRFGEMNTNIQAAAMW
ncbi:dual oxidase maturation factor 1-like isoform X3 [Tachypleus tridentatus]|uniref:dual oxidase maturation factor 1-like isoform X3 n=1 Tax=Tachypleus tridentatus TaxID=6853 RepID=UPI003FD628D2